MVRDGVRGGARRSGRLLLGRRERRLTIARTRGRIRPKIPVDQKTHFNVIVIL